MSHPDNMDAQPDSDAQDDKNWFARHKIATIVIGVIAVVIIGSAAVGGNSDDDDGNDSGGGSEHVAEVDGGGESEHATDMTDSEFADEYAKGNAERLERIAVPASAKGICRDLDHPKKWPEIVHERMDDTRWLIGMKQGVGIVEFGKAAVDNYCSEFSDYMRDPKNRVDEFNDAYLVRKMRDSDPELERDVIIDEGHEVCELFRSGKSESEVSEYLRTSRVKGVPVGLSNTVSRIAYCPEFR